MPWSPDNPYIGEFEDLPVQMLPRSSFFVPAEEAPLVLPMEPVAAPACELTAAPITVEPMPTSVLLDELAVALPFPAAHHSASALPIHPPTEADLGAFATSPRPAVPVFDAGESPLPPIPNFASLHTRDFTYLDDAYVPSPASPSDVAASAVETPRTDGDGTGESVLPIIDMPMPPREIAFAKADRSTSYGASNSVSCAVIDAHAGYGVPSSTALPLVTEHTADRDGIMLGIIVQRIPHHAARHAVHKDHRAHGAHAAHAVPVVSDYPHYDLHNMSFGKALGKILCQLK